MQPTLPKVPDFNQELIPTRGRPKEPLPEEKAPLLPPRNNAKQFSAFPIPKLNAKTPLTPQNIGQPPPPTPTANQSRGIIQRIVDWFLGIELEHTHRAVPHPSQKDPIVIPLTFKEGSTSAHRIEQENTEILGDLENCKKKKTTIKTNIQGQSLAPLSRSEELEQKQAVLVRALTLFDADQKGITQGKSFEDFLDEMGFDHKKKEPLNIDLLGGCVAIYEKQQKIYENAREVERLEGEIGTALANAGLNEINPENNRLNIANEIEVSEYARDKRKLEEHQLSVGAAKTLLNGVNPADPNAVEAAITQRKKANQDLTVQLKTLKTAQEDLIEKLADPAYKVHELRTEIIELGGGTREEQSAWVSIKDVFGPIFNSNYEAEKKANIKQKRKDLEDSPENKELQSLNTAIKVNKEAQKKAQENIWENNNQILHLRDHLRRKEPEIERLEKKLDSQDEPKAEHFRTAQDMLEELRQPKTENDRLEKENQTLGEENTQISPHLTHFNDENTRLKAENAELSARPQQDGFVTDLINKNQTKITENEKKITEYESKAAENTKKIENNKTTIEKNKLKIEDQTRKDQIAQIEPIVEHEKKITEILNPNFQKIENEKKKETEEIEPLRKKGFTDDQIQDVKGTVVLLEKRITDLQVINTDLAKNPLLSKADTEKVEKNNKEITERENHIKSFKAILKTRKEVESLYDKISPTQNEVDIDKQILAKKIQTASPPQRPQGIQREPSDLREGIKNLKTWQDKAIGHQDSADVSPNNVNFFGTFEKSPTHSRFVKQQQEGAYYDHTGAPPGTSGERLDWNQKDIKDLGRSDQNNFLSNSYAPTKADGKPEMLTIEGKEYKTVMHYMIEKKLEKRLEELNENPKLNERAIKTVEYTLKKVKASETAKIACEWVKVQNKYGDIYNPQFGLFSRMDNELKTALYYKFIGPDGNPTKEGEMLLNTGSKQLYFGFGYMEDEILIGDPSYGMHIVNKNGDITLEGKNKLGVCLMELRESMKRREGKAIERGYWPPGPASPTEHTPPSAQPARVSRPIVEDYEEPEAAKTEQQKPKEPVIESPPASPKATRVSPMSPDYKDDDEIKFPKKNKT